MRYSSMKARVQEVGHVYKEALGMKEGEKVMKIRNYNIT